MESSQMPAGRAEGRPGSTVAVVVNPTKFDDVLLVRRELEGVAAAHGHHLRWLETTQDDTGTGQARQAVAEGAALVCSLGGDGTVRSVAEGLLGSDVPLGLLPGGTGNLLARNLGLPIASIAEAMEVALGDDERRIDVGRVSFDGGDEEIFLVMCGMGLDAEAMVDTPEEVKARLGWVSYGITGARKMIDRGIHVWVEGDMANGHGRFDQHVRSLLVGNCGTLQGGVLLMPDAEVDDGRLDLLAFAPHGVVGWAAALWTIATRQRHGHRSLRQVAGTGFRVRTRRPCEAEVDGDPVGAHQRMETRVDPGALLVRCTQ